ncbi:MAG: hypothetical protein ACREVL_11575 [Solimonas sp.]
MAKCDYCGNTILFGAVKNGNLTFCNKDHQQKGGLLVAAEQLPVDLVESETLRIHRGNCPKCSGPGPVDVRNSYIIRSFVLMTQWRTKTIVACRNCGRKENLKEGLLSALLGWWGFPWGLLMTPVQIVKNISGAASSASEQPSPALRQVIRAHLASRLPAAPPSAMPVAPGRVPPSL